MISIKVNIRVLVHLLKYFFNRQEKHLLELNHYHYGTIVSVKQIKKLTINQHEND